MVLLDLSGKFDRRKLKNFIIKIFINKNFFAFLFYCIRNTSFILLMIFFGIGLILTEANPLRILAIVRRIKDIFLMQ